MINLGGSPKQQELAIEMVTPPNKQPFGFINPRLTLGMKSGIPLCSMNEQDLMGCRHDDFPFQHWFNVVPREMCSLAYSHFSL